MELCSAIPGSQTPGRKGDNRARTPVVRIGYDPLERGRLPPAREIECFDGLRYTPLAGSVGDTDVAAKLHGWMLALAGQAASSYAAPGKRGITRPDAGRHEKDAGL